MKIGDIVVDVTGVLLESPESVGVIKELDGNNAIVIYSNGVERHKGTLNIFPIESIIKTDLVLMARSLKSLQRAMVDIDYYGGNKNEPFIYMDKVKELAKAGRKIEAIKMLCLHSGMGLREGKQVVDDL